MKLSGQVFGQFVLDALDLRLHLLPVLSQHLLGGLRGGLPELLVRDLWLLRLLETRFGFLPFTSFLEQSRHRHHVRLSLLGLCFLLL
jgi:hypothetical protein